MAARPSDPWPRGRGHVLLAFPGTREEDKGYHEPGGSFSPGVRSFGLAHVEVDRVVAAFPDLAPGTADCPRGCQHPAPDDVAMTETSDAPTA